LELSDGRAEASGELIASVTVREAVAEVPP
jgi:uncharacterized metal-binding protein YceD (DUF177 family)